MGVAISLYWPHRHASRFRIWSCNGRVECYTPLAAPSITATMTIPTITPHEIRTALLLREEIALLDLRHEAEFATGHPLFAANMAAGRIALEAELRLPRKDALIVVYDAGEGLAAEAADRLAALGYSNVRALDGGLQAWKDAGYELFQDV